ncbi:glycosyltransferase family 4 protein [Nitrospira sp. M1]
MKHYSNPIDHNVSRNLPSSLHILYLNHYLNRSESEQGTWGQKFVHELRGLGIQVTTIPEFSNNEYHTATHSSLQTGRLQVFLQTHAPRWLQHLLIEPIAIVRGIQNTYTGWRQVKAMTGLSPDVIYGRVLYCDWTPLLVGLALKCPIILEVHSPHYLERTFRGWRKSRFLRMFERIQWRRATFIRIVSKPMLRVMMDEGVTAQRIRFIPYGVNIIPRRQVTHQSLKQPLTIIFVGSFYSYHGVSTLLHAFALVQKQIPYARLELIGDGLTRRSDEQLSKRLDLEDAVTFHGWLPRETMLKHIHLADIAVAPFLSLEPFYFDPVKLLDYMSTGIAIVASSLERIVEMLQEGRGGLLFPVGDTNALASSIIKLASSPELCNRLGEAAQAILIEEGYSWEITALRIKKLCEETTVT